MKKKHIIFTAILVLAATYRLFGIMNPLLDFHGWRQTGTASIAANFYEQGMNIFHPKLDTFSDPNTTTLQGIEFQFYPYIVACFYCFFGIQDWIGRLISILFGLAVIPYLYFLTKKYYTEKIALWSCFFYAVLPMAVYYTRTVQPEAAMLFFSIAALYHFSCYVDSEKKLDFILSSVSALLCFLSKIPTLYMLFPMMFLAWNRFNFKVFTQKRWIIFFLISVFPALLWTWKAPDILGSASLLNADGKWITLDLLFSLEFYRHIFLTRIAEKMFAFTLFPFLLWGLWVQFKTEKKSVFLVWFGAIILYIFAVGQGNVVHEYYQVPIILPGVVFSALGLDILQKKAIDSSKNRKIILILIWACILFVPIHSVYKLRSRLKVDWTSYYLGNALKKVSQAQDFALSHNDAEPEIFYYARRKGWHVQKEVSVQEVESRIRQGAKFFVSSYKDLDQFNPELYSYLNEKGLKVYNSSFGTIYKFKEKE